MRPSSVIVTKPARLIVPANAGDLIARLEPLDRRAMKIGPGDRLLVEREQEMMRRRRPAHLRADFRKHPGRFVADPHGAAFAYSVRKRLPVLPAFDIGQHRRMEDDQRHAARRLCGKLSQINAQIPADDARRVLTRDCQRGAKVVAVEPAGPPFQNTVFGTDKARAWGVADIPITYDPPVNDPGELKIEQEAQPDEPDLVRCWLQQTPARRLVNLANIPAIVITAEASYHAVYDHCTAKYLTQAGVKVTALRLGDHGIHGNAHMIMLEKNNLQVAGLIAAWLARTIPAR